jgi:hypothetical protein
VLFLVHRFLSPRWRRRQVPPKHRFLQEPHDVTSQKTPFFTVNVVPSSLILSTVKMEAIRSSERSALSRTPGGIPEGGILPVISYYIVFHGELSVQLTLLFNSLKQAMTWRCRHVIHEYLVLPEMFSLAGKQICALRHIYPSLARIQRFHSSKQIPVYLPKI